MSDISSCGTSEMSSCVRRMKNEIRSTLGLVSSIWRSARTSHDVPAPRARGPHRVAAGLERAQEVAIGAGGGVVEAAGRRAVGDEHHAGEVAAVVAAAHVLERLADRGGRPGGGGARDRGLARR